jgi:hypothetical protein
VNIQLLYSIAQRVFENEVPLEEVKKDALKIVSSHVYTQLNKAKKMLIEDVLDESSRK